MTTLLRSTRRAFTLVELLVVMTVIIVLTSLTLMVLVNMGERDGTTDAAGLTRQWLMIAKARASRDGAPRGLRLVVGMDPNNIAKTSPYWVTDIQYIEAPPILVTYPAQNGDFVPTGSPTDPRVEFTYVLSPGVTAALGNVIAKQCQILNLQASDAAQIQPNCLLQLPVIGTWHRIMSVTSVVQSPPASGRFTVTVGLDAFPDSQMGASGTFVPPTPPNPAGTPAPPCYVTLLFGITAPPRPLVGEPPLPLPKNICIDLTYTQDSAGNAVFNLAPPPANSAGPYYESPSRPQGSIAAADYDILFAPNGTVVPVGAGAGADGQIYLWHRDYTKIRGLRSPLTITSIGPGPTFIKTYDMTPFQQGGEQQIVAIKCKTGALGQFPVKWPDAGGQYTIGDPYYFAQQGVTSP